MPLVQLSVDADHLEVPDNRQSEPTSHAPVTDWNIGNAFRSRSVPGTNLSAATFDPGEAGSIVTNDG